MNSLVLVKSIIDSPDKFQIIDDKLEVEADNKTINPWDLSAIEAAVQFKERFGGEVTVLTIGTESSKQALRRALALGCDNAILVSSSDGIFYDNKLLATIIKSVVNLIGNHVVIFGGYFFTDTNDSTLLIQVSRLLDYGYISLVTQIFEFNELDATILINRRLNGIQETLLTKTPIIMTIDKAYKAPRYSSFLTLQNAANAPIIEYSINDLKITPSFHGSKCIEINKVEITKTHCEFINGYTPFEIAEGLYCELQSKGLL